MKLMPPWHLKQDGKQVNICSINDSTTLNHSLDTLSTLPGNHKKNRKEKYKQNKKQK